MKNFQTEKGVKTLLSQNPELETASLTDENRQYMKKKIEEDINYAIATLKVYTQKAYNPAKENLQETILKTGFLMRDKFQTNIFRRLKKTGKMRELGLRPEAFDEKTLQKFDPQPLQDKQ